MPKEMVTMTSGEMFWSLSKASSDAERTADVQFVPVHGDIVEDERRK